MKIRSLLPQDKKHIHNLLVSTGVFRPEEIKVAMEVVNFTLRHPNKGDYFIFCALNGSNEITGYICFGPIPLTESSFDLYWIAVNPRYTSRGVGRKLLNFAESFCRKKGASKIYIDTSSSPNYQASRYFYTKNGYRPICQLDNFYRLGDHKIIFVKEIF